MRLASAYLNENPDRTLLLGAHVGFKARIHRVARVCDHTEARFFGNKVEEARADS